MAAVAQVEFRRFDKNVAGAGGGGVAEAGAGAGAKAKTKALWALIEQPNKCAKL